MAARAARIAAWAYLLLGLASLGLIVLSETGIAPGNLAAVYALLLAMPWSLAFGPLGIAGPGPAFVLLGAGIAVNAALLFALARWLARRTSR